MINKHHMYTHCTIRLYINIHKFSSIFQQMKCNSLYLRINVILYLRTKCKTLYKVRQVKIFVQSANCTFGEQLQKNKCTINYSAVLMGLGWPISFDQL